MKVIVENTMEQYETMFAMTEGREDYFRYTMMKPFEPMWKTIQVPLQPKQHGGYDVLMAVDMLGYMPVFEEEKGREAIAKLKEINALQTAKATLRLCVERMKKKDIEVKTNELRFGIYIANPEKLKLQKGYCGFGGIPGFIHVSIFPNSYNIPRLPAVIAHEFHHNIRFSYFDWDHGNVTVGDYLVIEGLAESFAKELYGEHLLGPWVTSIDKDDLLYSLAVIKENLGVKGFAEVSSYMFGDVFAKEQGYSPVGLSPFAGYAVGYELVQSFMRENGIGIEEATFLSTKDIIGNCRMFE
ncbi:DUF2268 domain-containing protein [Alkalihalobacterium bogoriense]|uniref:DUF2268 domain-containing protein n=1 Tax=Alkalihalobacterium bogoriense TaxID=246272 RepID=UPI00047EDAFE|nr:DUF2268 domain-containing protein [Alkalihalobacterium bogoriense]